MDVQVKTVRFEPSDFIFVAFFIHNFKPFYDSNGIQDDTAVRLFQQFMKFVGNLIRADQFVLPVRTTLNKSWSWRLIV